MSVYFTQLLTQSATYKMARKDLLNVIFSHMNGIVLSSIVGILENHGHLDALVKKSQITAKDLQNIPEGYRHLILRLFAREKWLYPQDAYLDAGRPFSLTEEGREHLKHAKDYKTAKDLLFHFPGPEFLDKALAFFVKTKNLPQNIARHLQGHLIAPVMSSLTALGITKKITFHNYRLQDCHLPLLKILERAGWVFLDEDATEFSIDGILACEMAYFYEYPIAYLPLLKNLPAICSNAPASPSIDRKKDITFSSMVFANPLKSTFMECILPIFDLPLEKQPKALVDIGCGDGKMLAACYREILKKTLRGRHVKDFPLILIGADISQEARACAADTLQEMQSSFHVLDGDINDPDSLSHTVQEKCGFPLNDCLIINKSVIHDRTFIPPKKVLDSATSAVFIHPSGEKIQAAEIFGSLVECLKKWRPHSKKHGWAIIEPHTMHLDAAPPQELCSPITALEALHGFSHQYLIESSVFSHALELSGFTIQRQKEFGEKIFGAPQLTVSYCR